MQTIEYEYEVTTPNIERLESHLNKKGKEGWRLVSLQVHHSMATVVMEKHTSIFDMDTFGL